MTLSERNLFFKIGIAFCAICTLLILAASILTIPVYPEMEENLRRPANFLQTLSNNILESNYYAVHASIAISVLFSLIGLVLIYYFFERTSAPEILYIALFAISLSFEAIRLILPLHQLLNFPSLYIGVATRVLLFARFFGVFSLFAASICAAGLDIQKTQTVVIAITIAAIIITFGVPIDVLTWDTSLNIVKGYTSMLRMIEIAAFITAMISFFIASNIREAKEYTYIAAGIILVFVGRSILLNTDNWIGPVLGIMLLSFGTWFICSKLHKIYLWL